MTMLCNDEISALELNYPEFIKTACTGGENVEF